MRENNFKKNLIWNMIGVTTNAFTSLFYLSIVTRLNGLETAGFFSFAFSNAMLLAIIGMYMGRTYQVSERKCSDASFAVVRIFSCLAMLAVGLAMLGFNDYGHEETLVFLIWLLLKTVDSFIDYIYGVVQKADRLYYAGMSLTLKAVFSVAAFLMIDLFTYNIAAASGGALAVNIIVILLLDIPKYLQNKERSQVKKKELFFLLKDGFYIFATTLLCNYLINASRYALNQQGANKEQAIFGIIIMPATFMILVGQYLLHPYLIRLTNLFCQSKWRELTRIVLLMTAILLGIGVLGVLAAMTLGIPVLQLIYGTKLEAYRMDLAIVMAGATIYSIVLVIINMLTIMRVNKTQFVVFAVDGAATYVLARYLVQTAGVRGGTWTYLLSMSFALAVFAVIIVWRFRKGLKGAAA